MGVGEKERKNRETDLGLGFKISLYTDEGGFGVATHCEDCARGWKLDGSWDVVGGWVLRGESD